MQDEGKTVQEEVVNDVTAENVEQVKEEAPKKVIVPITDPQERLLALQEIEVLTKFINTKFIYPKFSKGNGNKIQPQLVGGTELSYFSQADMSIAGNRVLELTERICANGETN